MHAFRFCLISQGVQCRTLKCPLLDDVSDSGCCFAKPQEWPSGWHVSELDDVRYFNIAGPDWAALDAHINPWGKVDDGLWELAMDKYAFPC